MGNSSLFDGRGKYFGREDYWYSNPVWNGRNVHNTYHIHACIDVGKSQENLKGNLNTHLQQAVIVFIEYEYQA